MSRVGIPLGDARAIVALSVEVRELLRRCTSHTQREAAQSILDLHGETIAEARRLVAAAGTTTRRPCERCREEDDGVPLIVDGPKHTYEPGCSRFDEWSGE